MRLSIVTTMYYSAPYLEEFYTRICACAEKITNEYEIIFVNDGSPDNSLDIAVSLHENDSKVRVIDLSRNFGHHKAIMTGLAHARGDLVFLIDCDLEEEPELLNKFYEEMGLEDDIDVVYGVQKARKGSFYERLFGSLFYALINFLSNWPVPTNVSTVRLMKKNYVKNLIRHADNEIFLIGLWVLTGFKQKPVTITKLWRRETTYNLKKKISNFVNAVTSFSSKPLVYIFYTGSIILLVSTSYVLYLLYRGLFMNIPVPGYASLIISIWFLGGLTIFSIGIVGIYISVIFSETKDRPYTIIKSIYQKD